MSVGTIGLFYLMAAVSVRIVDGSIEANTGLSFAYSLVYLSAILAIAYLFSAIMRSSGYSLVVMLGDILEWEQSNRAIFYRTGCLVSNGDTPAIRYRSPCMTSL